MSEPVRWRDFWGLHREGWGDRIVAEAFAHPAKIRPALAQKIVSHGIAQGWWVPGVTTIVDPFTGIGGCLLVCGWNGLASIGVELEPHFVDLCGQNIALHDPIWGRDGCVRPVVVQGDSRELGRHVAAAMGSLSSPPYADAVSSDGSGIDWGKSVNPRTRDDKSVQNAEAHAGRYGRTPGNLGNLPMGSVSSPPYSTALTRGDSVPDTPNSARMAEMGGRMLYGKTEGQLGEMPGGSIGSPPYADDAPGAGGLNTKPPREGTDDQSGRKAGPSQAGVGGCVGSPPYAESLQNPGGSRCNAEGFTLGQSSPGATGDTATSYGSTPGQLGAMKAGSLASPPFEECLSGGKEAPFTRRPDGTAFGAGAAMTHDYGETAGQLGNEKGTTFWDALRVIAGELHALLPEGAVSAWVVKDFCRQGKRVPFCDDCATLLEQTGFQVFERWRCWMVSAAKQTDMFTGESKPIKSQKGFFRRLAEAKGSPRIDFEEALWFRKPAKERDE